MIRLKVAEMTFKHRFLIRRYFCCKSFTKIDRRSTSDNSFREHIQTDVGRRKSEINLSIPTDHGPQKWRGDINLVISRWRMAQRGGSSARRRQRCGADCRAIMCATRRLALVRRRRRRPKSISSPLRRRRWRKGKRMKTQLLTTALPACCRSSSCPRHIVYTEDTAHRRWWATFVKLRELLSRPLSTEVLISNSVSSHGLKWLDSAFAFHKQYVICLWT